MVSAFFGLRRYACTRRCAGGVLRSVVHVRPALSERTPPSSRLDDGHTRSDLPVIRQFNLADNPFSIPGLQSIPSSVAPSVDLKTPHLSRRSQASWLSINLPEARVHVRLDQSQIDCACLVAATQNFPVAIL